MFPSLNFEVHLDELPSSLSIQQILLLMEHEAPVQEDQQQSIQAYCKARDIFSIDDMWDDGTGWKSLVELQGELQETRFANVSTLEAIFEFINSSKGRGRHSLTLASLEC